MSRSVKEKETKKQYMTMIKNLLYIVCFIASFSGYAQTSNKTEQGKKVLYVKDKKYKGPNEWYGNSPKEFSEKDNYDATSNPYSLEGTNYNDEQIVRERKNRARKEEKGNGFGTGGDQTPIEIQEPEPIEVPEFDPPDIDAPDINAPDIDLPSISEYFWRTILIILILVALFFIIYFIVKNKKPAITKVTYKEEDKWNPEIVSKSELEIRLENCLQNQNYREAIRVYFTFILKDLIRLNEIKWKQEKTNLQYSIELSGKEYSKDFNKITYMFDLVWYGEYNLTMEEFKNIEPAFVSFLKQLNAK